MSRRHRPALALLVLVLATPIAAAQASWSPRDRETSRLWFDHRGRAVEGVLRDRGPEFVEVATLLGTAQLATAELEDRATDELRARYRRRVQDLDEKPKPGDRVALATWCERVGLTSGLAEQLEALVQESPEDPGLWSLVRRLAPIHRPAPSNTTSPEKTRWARKEADLLFRGLSSANLAQAALLAERLAALPAELTLNDALKASRRGRAPERWVAARLLGGSPDVRRVKPLYVAALNDPAWQVRLAAVRSLRRRDDGTTLGPFLKVLLTEERVDRRLYAAEALGELGDARAVPALIRALKATTGGPGKARANLVVLDQIAYVKDYDVEVAQSATIADPIIDVAQSGVVLDVAVVGISVQRGTYGAALSRLTGADLGADVEEWSAWFEKNRSRF